MSQSNRAISSIMKGRKGSYQQTSHSLEDNNIIMVTDGGDKINSEDLLFEPFGLTTKWLHKNKVGEAGVVNQLIIRKQC